MTPEARERKRTYDVEYHRARPEKVRAANAKWYRGNSEKARASDVKYRCENPEKVRANNAKWQRENPDKVSAYVHVRRALKKAAPGKFTAADLKAQFAVQSGRCFFCGCALPQSNRGLARKDHRHIEHKTPLVRGGSNWPSNIVWSCSPCNLRKGTKTLEEFTEILMKDRRLPLLTEADALRRAVGRATGPLAAELAAKMRRTIRVVERTHNAPRPVITSKPRAARAPRRAARRPTATASINSGGDDGPAPPHAPIGGAS